MGVVLLFLGLAVLYFIAIAMPNKKWLTTLFILYGALIGGSYSLFSKSGDWMGLILLIGACATAFSGVFAKALSFFLKKKNYSNKIYLLPLILGLPIGITIFVFPFKYHDWKERPVENACYGQLFPFKIGDVTFDLPFSPVFSLYFKPFNVLEAFKEGIVFYEPSGVKKACKIMEGGIPVLGTKLGIIIKNVEYARPDSVHTTLCRSTQVAWEKELCSHNLKTDTLGYPFKIFIYAKAAFVTPWNNNPSETTYQKYQDDVRYSPKSDTMHGYTHAGNHYYWVADNPEWKTPDGNPFTLSCDASTDKTTVSCLVVYGLTDQVNVQFVLWGPSQETPEKAWQQHNKLLSLISAVRIKSKSQE